jgi:hypothetical protein
VWIFVCSWSLGYVVLHSLSCLLMYPFLRRTGYALFWMDIITMFGQSRSAGLAAEKRLLFMVIRKTCLEFRRCCERIKKGKIGIVDGVCMSVLYNRYRVMITQFQQPCRFTAPVCNAPSHRQERSSDIYKRSNASSQTY